MVALAFAASLALAQANQPAPQAPNGQPAKPGQEMNARPGRQGRGPQGPQMRRYNASFFGIKSNGLIDNTASFQKAVDFISENGGGVLVISVGRYLTGAVELKSNVSISIRGTIVGSSNIFDYRGHKAIFWADGAENISISGGVIEGQGAAIREQVKGLKEKSYISDDCPLPTLVYFKDCKKVSMNRVICRYPATEELYSSENSDAKFEGCINDTKE